MLKLLKLVSLLVITAVGSSVQAERVLTYYHNDLSGSPVMATDEAGQVLWKESYKPYGERLEQDLESADNHLWYTGKAHNEDTGLTYFGARYYNPTLGRFMGTDPQGFVQNNLHSFNRYAYANNNPYKYIDPDGHSAVTAFGGLLYETGQLFSGNGFNGAAIAGAFVDGYNGEGNGFASALFEDVTSFVPTGLAVGGAAKLSKFGRAKGTGKTFFRSMSKAEADAVKKTGKLRGGNPGETFFTDSRFKTADKAQDRLSLPNKPEVQIEFKIKNKVKIERNGTKVEPAFGGRGGGKEFMTNNPVEVEIINVQPF